MGRVDNQIFYSLFSALQCLCAWHFSGFTLVEGFPYSGSEIILLQLVWFDGYLYFYILETRNVSTHKSQHYIAKSTIKWQTYVLCVKLMTINIFRGNFHIYLDLFREFNSLIYRDSVKVLLTKISKSA